VAQFAIRAPSVADLFDPFSTEPLEDRPLREEVRERILRVWIDTRDERPEYLTVELPEGERRDEVTPLVQAAVRNDLRAAYEASSKFLIFPARSERREAYVAFGFLVVCLVASSLFDKWTDNETVFVGISQGLVVLGWVAMWQPAQQLFQAISLWLSRNRYRELAEVPIEVSWV
jgi:hypothetical protein